jgi:hypothetical protein
VAQLTVYELINYFSWKADTTKVDHNQWLQ